MALRPAVSDGLPKTYQNHVRHLPPPVIPVDTDGVWQQVDRTGGHDSEPFFFCIFSLPLSSCYYRIRPASRCLHGMHPPASKPRACIPIPGQRTHLRAQYPFFIIAKCLSRELPHFHPNPLFYLLCPYSDRLSQFPGHIGQIPQLTFTRPSGISRFDSPEYGAAGLLSRLYQHQYKMSVSVTGIGVALP